MNEYLQIDGSRVLVACEFSGKVREAFAKQGYDAWSCDLLPSSDGSNRHIQGDARNILHDGWDYLIVAHPPCTRLCNSGVSWLHKPPKGKSKDQMWAELDEGADLFNAFWNAPIPRIAVENPIMHKYAVERIGGQRQTQIVQPWWFGHPEQKATGLWLKNLPKLVKTNDVYEEMMRRPDRERQRLHYLPPSPDRWAIRSTTFQGLADAMADQWKAAA